MLRNEKNRFTPESNLDLAENQRQIQEIYNQWRDKGYSVEEVYYMISTAAHKCVLDEAFTGKKGGDRTVICINDLRPIINPITTIRVWDNSQAKELINPKALYEGNINNLSSNHKICSNPIVEMMSISGVLVFFIETTQNKSIIGGT